MKKTSISLMTIIALAGCAPVQETPAPARMATATCVFPVITPMPETSELQTKGGINISLAPAAFECVPAVDTVSRELQPSFADTMAFNLSNPNADRNAFRYVEVSRIPTFKVEPERISFLVKINNQMPRVFRGAGTVVLYNFGGQNVSISSRDYAELTNVIVPPRTEAEVLIFGPPLSNVPDDTTFGIFLYDVVISTDAAGNVTEKQNFEWFYNYKTQTLEESREITSETGWVRR